MRFEYIPNRVIGLNGIADGANIYFYQSGTTTPISIYADDAYTTPLANPYQVVTGAAVPSIYWNYAGAVRVRIVESSGSVPYDEDPYDNLRNELDSTGGAGIVGTADGNTVQEELDSLNLVVGELAFVPEAYGAVGDGVTDDTAALQAMFNAARAANGTAFLTAGTYRITANVFIYNGLRRFIGQGGTILLDQASGVTSLVLGVTGGVPVSNCLIEGITINANGKSTLGIYGQNINNCTIRRNRVYGLTNTTSAYGIFLKALAGFALNLEDVIVEGNLIQGQETIASQVDPQQGIVIASDWTTPYNGYADATAEWKATFTNIAPDYVARRVLVRGNIVHGGRYGIFAAGAQDCVFEGNYTQNNIRAFSVQLQANRNMFKGNVCKDWLSDGIGLGYSCSDNLIQGNLCTSSIADSLTEAALFAYVGCKRNTFINNKVRVTSANGTGYMLYTAIHADQNAFINNDTSGPVQRAHCAVESSWDTTIVNTAHRAQGGGAALNGFANTGTNNVTFKGNIIEAVGTAKLAFFMAQVTDTGSRALARWQVCDNTVVGTPLRFIEVFEETSGLNQNAYLTNNRHIFDSTSGFLMSRGVGHFIMFDELGLNYTATYDPPSIAAGSSATTNVGVSGAALGDFVEASFSLDLQGLTLTASVTAANQVTVVLSNNTAGAIDLGSGTLRVRVQKA